MKTRFARWLMLPMLVMTSHVFAIEREKEEFALRAQERDVARELLELELSGWRVEDADLRCQEPLALKLVKGGTVETMQLPRRRAVVLDAKRGFKVISIERDPEDASVRVVNFEVYPDSGSRAPASQRDRLTFIFNGTLQEELGEASLLEAPKNLYFRKGCQ